MSDDASEIRPYHLWLLRLLLLAALAGTFYGFVEFWRSWQLVHRGIHGQAVVIAYQTNRASGRSSTTYLPILRFVDPAGKTWEKGDYQAKSSRAYSLGQIVEILYPPGKPGEFETVSWDNLWSLGTVLVSIGSLVSLMLYAALYFLSAVVSPAGAVTG